MLLLSANDGGHGASIMQRLDRAYQRIPTWAVGILAGLVLLVIEAMGGDSGAPFIYFQF